MGLRRACASTGVLLALVATGCTGTDTSVVPVSDAVEVTVAGFAFRDETVSVAVGGTVTWTNTDAPPHPLLFENGQRYSLAGGDTVTVTFPDTGVFAYRCAVHRGMTGTVSVVDATQGASVGESQPKRSTLPGGY